MKDRRRNPLMIVAISCLTFFAMSILAGCGGGGTSTSGIPSDGSGGGTGGGGGIVPSGPVGYITVSFSGSSAPATMVPVRTGGLATIAGLRTHFRVVVRRVVQQEILDEENNPATINVEVLRAVQDNVIDGVVQIAVPAATGYTAEVLTYDQEGSINYMLEYWKSNLFDLASGQNFTPTWAINGAAVSTFINMSLPDNVTSRFSYTASVTKTVPLRQTYYLTQQESIATWPIADFNPIAAAGYGTPDSIPRTVPTVSLTAPIVDIAQNLYLQGQFFIDDSLLKDAERLPATTPAWSNWRINCPDPRYNDNVVSTLLLPGYVTIDL